MLSPRPTPAARPGRWRQRGFTLLEVMIALSIFALIGLTSYTLLSSELRAQQRLREASAERNYWQRGMSRLSRDLLQAVPRSVREDYGSRETALIGNQDSVTLTRGGWDNPLARQRSNLQRVHYRVVRDDQEHSYLERSFWHSLDRAPGSEPVQQRVLPGVEAISLRYLDAADGQWHLQWPPHTRNSDSIDNGERALPLAVEITLSSPRLGELRRLVALGSPGTEP